MESDMFQANVQARVVDLYKTKKNKNALKILDTISYFSSDNISEKYLLDLVGGREQLKSAVKLLKKYSVVNLSEEPFGLNISMPVQEAVRKILKRKKKEVVTLSDALSTFQWNLECAGSLSHPISTWNFAVAYENLVMRFSSITYKIVIKLGIHGRNSEAYEFGSKQLPVLKEYDSKYKNQLKYRIGNLFFKEGKFQEALEWYNADDSYRGINIFLRYAASDGFLDIAKFILEERGIDNKIFGRLSLMACAVKSGNLEMVKLFVEKGVNMELGYITSVHYATNLNKLDIVKFLIESGANIKCTDNRGYNLVHSAAEYGYLDILKFLVKSGADFKLPDYSDVTPLHVAAEGGHLDCVKFLVQSGADVNFTDVYLRNSLHLAADKGHLDIIKFLIRKGANINERDVRLMTPLDYAVEKIDPVKIIDHKGSTLLHYAVYLGHTNLVKKILKLVKSDRLYDFLDCRTKGGNTAMDLAIKRNDKTIIKLLDNAWEEVSTI